MVDVRLGVRILDFVNADAGINPLSTVLDLGVPRAAKRAGTKYSCVYVHGQYQKI